MAQYPWLCSGYLITVLQFIASFTGAPQLLFTFVCSIVQILFVLSWHYVSQHNAFIEAFRSLYPRTMFVSGHERSDPVTITGCR